MDGIPIICAIIKCGGFKRQTLSATRDRKETEWRMRMFREMRRKKQRLSAEACEAILAEGTSGVLAVDGDGGYPYAVPLSYVYQDGKLFFHCAKSGHMLDAVRRNPRASFCVIGQDRVVPEEYTSYFRSVIVFGTIRVLQEEREIRAAVRSLAVKYAPEDSEENRELAIQKEYSALCMLELTAEHITGKEAIELARSKERVFLDS